MKRLRQTFPYRFEKKKPAADSDTAVESKPECNKLEENEHQEKDKNEIEDSDDEINPKTVKQKLKKLNKNALPEINLEELVLNDFIKYEISI